MSRGKVVVIFGQFGALADPINLPHFNQRLKAAGFDTILVEHTDSQKAYDFLRHYAGFKAIVGASLGAGAAPLFASNLKPAKVDFVGGFQPSYWDPLVHNDTVTVPDNVKNAVCFRNPNFIATAGLGYGTYVIDPNNHVTKLRVIERGDVHPGDFGSAADLMFSEIEKSAGAQK